MVRRLDKPTDTRRNPVTRIIRAKILAIATLVAIVAVSATASVASAAVKLPKTGVEKPPSATLSETGSTLLYPLWNLWVPGYTTSYSNVNIQTAGTGSGTGITDATNGTADIGASDAYLSPSQVSASPSLLNIPLAISAQLVVYNVPGVQAHLKLSGKVLSEIYQGKIKTWNDPAITAINSGVNLPSTPIVTLHRSDSSGDTFLFTTYLSKADNSGWAEHADRDAPPVGLER
jgi:phosphate ABC transporter phosphate-binding protein